MTQHTPLPIPPDWDRRGLPGWSYHSPALFELETWEVFLNHWQVAGHVSDIPAAGDWLGFDLLGERAVVMRGKDGEVRAFHNLCRHRGARVVDGAAGHCKGAMVCPFHGWVYNLDGTLRGAARPESFGDMDRADFGLKPIEMELWHGFIFLRFQPGPQPAIADLLDAYDADVAGYRPADMLPAGTPGQGTELPVNWKSVRDVDNEGYHVAMAHPALQDLYGRSYRDLIYPGGLLFSTAEFGDSPGRRWSVRHYLALTQARPHLPQRLRKAWTYYGLFPNAVIAFTPESMQVYQEIPQSLDKTRLTSRLYRLANETRRERAARYLAMRIDRETSAEDQQLSIWSNESMKSSAFEDFHLSDLEIGLRCHHDQLRQLVPVLRLAEPPVEAALWDTNQNLFAAAGEAPNLFGGRGSQRGASR